MYRSSWGRDFRRLAATYQSDAGRFSAVAVILLILLWLLAFLRSQHFARPGSGTPSGWRKRTRRFGELTLVTIGIGTVFGAAVAVSLNASDMPESLLVLDRR